MDKSKIYRKLNFEYNKIKLTKEILSNAGHFHQMPPDFLTIKKRKFSILDSGDYEKLTLVNGDKILKGQYDSWKGLCFTHKKGEYVSLSGKNNLRSLLKEWSWREDLNSNYLIQIVNELGFYEIQNVRVMIIDTNNFGPVHKDACDENYYDDHVSVTLNLEDGGKPLLALINEELIEINDDAFIFCDNCWHGVGRVNSRRIQVRINGKSDIITKFYGF